jgi:hypothetical protein
MEDESIDSVIIFTPALSYLKEGFIDHTSGLCKFIQAGSRRSILSMILPEIHETAKILGKVDIPLYPSPEHAAKAYSVMV